MENQDVFFFKKRKKMKFENCIDILTKQNISFVNFREKKED